MSSPRALLVVVVALLAAACGSVDGLERWLDRAGEAGDQVTEVADHARFCFAVTRALTGVEGGTSPEQAYEAAEEVLAQVPDELRDEADTVTRTLERAVEEDDPSHLQDEEFQAAAQRLRNGTRELCDPRR